MARLPDIIMDQTIDSIVNKTHQIKGKISELVTSYQYPNNNKSQILLAYHSLLAEHHSAIFLLVQNSLYGSAFALVRSLYELLYRAHWVIGCATEKQVEEILEGKDIYPKMYIMVKEIDTAFGIGNYFQNIKKNSWGPMNDYTHSGLRQISRRFEDNEVSPNYETGEIIEVLDGINIALILMGLVFFKEFRKEKAFKVCGEILAEYTADNQQATS